MKLMISDTSGMMTASGEMIRAIGGVGHIRSCDCNVTASSLAPGFLVL